MAFKQDKDERWVSAGIFESLAAGKTGVRTGRFGDPVLEGEFGVSEEKLENVVHTLTRRRFDILTRPGLESAIRTLLGETAAQVVREIPASLHPIQEGQVSPCRRYRFAAGMWRYNGGLNNPALLSALGVARLAVKARGRLLKGDPHLRPALGAAHDAHVQAYGPYDLAMIGKYVSQFPLLRVLVDTSGAPARVLEDVQRTAIQIRGGTISEVAQQLEAYGLLDEHALSAYARVPQVAANAHLLAEYAFDGKMWEANATYYRGNAAQKAQACDTLAAEEQGVRQTAILTQAAKLRAMTPWKDLCDMTLEPRDVLLPEQVLTAWVNIYLGTRTTVKRNQWDQEGVEAELIHASRSSYGVQLRLRNTLKDDWNLADRKVVPGGRVRDLEEYLNYRTPVQSVQDEEAKTETQINAERSAFQLKAVHYERELAAHFRSWLLGSDLAGEVETVLNEARYGVIPPQPDMRALVLDAYQGPLAHPFQAGHVRTAARMDGVILNFDVGLGKTLSAMMLVALLKQSGRAQLPAIVVPLSRLGDWVMNAATALPGYRVLVVGGEPLRDAQGKFILNEDGEPEVREDTGAQRRVKIASLLTDAPDLVIFTAEAFEMIPMLHATHKRMIESNPSLMSGVGTADTFDDRHRKLGGHKALAKYESSLARHLNRVSVAEETDVPFEALGIDAVVADECHMYKNSHASPRVYGEGRPKFLGGGGESNRALDALHKYRFVRDQGGLTAGLTATFFGNSPLEIFNMLALHTDALETYGIPDVSTFVARFCVIEPRLIIQPSGDVEYVPCVIGFRNFDELRAILGQHVIKETELSCQMHDRVGLNLPPLEAVEHVFDLPEEVMSVYEAEQVNLNAPDSEGENHIFSIYARLLKLTLHPPLMSVDAPNIRFETCVQACLEARARGGSNLVFMYMGGENAQTYHALKTALITAGYPEREIEVITAQTHPGGGERLKVERRVRRGELTCVIGSKVIEEGGNYQGITDLHHMDYPYHHQAFVQRIGRARRQGTWVEVVRNHVYFARGSFDAVRYQLMLEKKGWADQVYDPSVTSCEFEGVGFSGEDLAVMFSRNPEATRAEIARKKEERAQQAREANMRADLGVIREYLDNLRELSRRHAKSLGRERGPSAQDRVGIAHLTRVVRGLHTQVEKLRAAGHPMAAITRLKLPVVWAGGLPLHKGLTLSLHGQQGIVVEALEGRGEITVKVGTDTGAWQVAKLLDAKDVQPTGAEDAFGVEAFERLAPSLRDGVLAGLSDGAQDALLTGALGTVPVVAEVLPEPVVTPLVAVVEVAAPVMVTAPLVRLSSRFGLSVAAQLPQEAEQVFAIQGDHLEPGTEGDMLLALVLRPNGEVRQVTVVLRDEARLAQARTLMCSGSTRLRERVMHLLSAA
ncbi:DEAD/DEAH box helicase [Deinococcus sp. Leaf326]|uniref:helicase-related protein n=1 Tax=Deinococcus sp. Leaf326 TaxID=1736338 RepID=UPI001F1CF3EF|nr:DEAD/DEAH box helicase [Deinococcus sp. Leaf326]